MDKHLIIVLATRRYIPLAMQMLRTADALFDPGYPVEYAVLTDAPFDSSGIARPCYVAGIKHVGWPTVALRRYDSILQHAGILARYTHITHLDADLEFIRPVGAELRIEGVYLTDHPVMPGCWGTPETRPESAACVRQGEPLRYVGGAHVGGDVKSFMEFAHDIDDGVTRDLNNGIVAIWHEESHLQRWSLDHKHTRLGVDYLARFRSPTARIICIKKNHAELRRP